MITLVTGGARSGKSSFAEGLLKDCHNVLYIATAIAFDDEMKERVRLHRKQRNQSWDTLEAYKNLEQEIKSKDQNYDGIILDCITIMISNLMLEEFNDNTDYRALENRVIEEMKASIRFLKALKAKVVLVTNEVGAGIVPENKLAREFRDIAGRVNQYIAKEADEVFVTISGISLQIK